MFLLINGKQNKLHASSAHSFGCRLLPCLFPSDHEYLKPVFIVALCRKPEIRNGMLSVDKDQYVESENVTIQCHFGFAMLGSQSITCSENRTWYPEVPRCEQVRNTDQGLLCHQALKCFPQPIVLTPDLLWVFSKLFREPVR